MSFIWVAGKLKSLNMNPSEKAAFVENWALFCLVQLLIGIEAKDGFLVICSGRGFKSRNADNIEIT